MAETTGSNLSIARTSTASTANQMVRSSESRWPRLLPLYVVIFFGFVGYSLMIMIFTPMILKPDTAMIAANTPMAGKTILFGLLLALYPCWPVCGLANHGFTFGSVSAANPCC